MSFFQNFKKEPVLTGNDANLIKLVRSIKKYDQTAYDRAIHIFPQTNFVAMEPNLLLSSPFKNDLRQLFNGLLINYSTLLQSQDNDHDYFITFQILSCFINKKEDIGEAVVKLVLSILNFQNDDLIIPSFEQFFPLFSSNTSFIKAFMQDGTLINAWTATTFSNKQSNNVDSIYHFLIDTFNNSPSLDPKKFEGFISIIIDSISTSNDLALCVLSLFYVKTNFCSLIDSNLNLINKRILEIRKVNCYSNFMKSDSPAVRQSLISLVKLAEPELSQQVLSLALNQSYYIPCNIFVNQLCRFSNIGQENFLSLLSKAPFSEKHECILSLFPPWKIGIDCDLLTDFLSQQKQSPDDILQELQVIIIDSSISELQAAFICVDMHLDNLLYSLFKKFDNYELLTPFIDRIFEVIIKSSKCLYIFSGLSEILEPILYMESLLSHIEALGNIPAFCDQLINDLTTKISLRTELKNEQFILWAIHSGHGNIINELVIDGPFELLDKLILSNFQGSPLSQLSDLELSNIMRKNGVISIPSLAHFQHSCQLQSLFDYYSVGTFLMKNNLASATDPIFQEFGIHCMSPQLATDALTIPSILPKLTDPTCPHVSAYQFDKNRPDSYIVMPSTSFSFSFFVSHFDEEFILLEFSKYNFVCYEDKIVTGIQEIPIDIHNHTFIDVEVNKNLGKVEICFKSITVDGQINQTSLLLDKEPINKNPTIGTSKGKPGSTFYVKGPLETTQISSGVLFAEYSGFYHHALAINATSQMMKNLFNVAPGNYSDVYNYLKTFSNIIKNGSINTDIETHSGMIRACIMNNVTSIDDTIFQICLEIVNPPFFRNEVHEKSFGFHNIDLQYLKAYRILFIDYDIWEKCHSKMSCVINDIIHKIEIEPRISQFFSLLPFCMDLITIYKIKSNQLNTLVSKLFELSSEPSYYLSYLLNPDLPPELCSLISSSSLILTKIPLKYISQLNSQLVLPLLKLYAKSSCSDVDIQSNSEDLDINIIGDKEIAEHVNYEQDKDLIINLAPFWALFVEDELFWDSLFCLLTKFCFSSVSDYDQSTVQRPELIPLIFELSCELYQKEQNFSPESLLFQVLKTFFSIINYSNISLFKYIPLLSQILTLGVKTKAFVIPYDFGNDFSPCRTPIVHDIEDEQNELFPNIPELLSSSNISNLLYKPSPSDSYTSDAFFGNNYPNYLNIAAEYSPISPQHLSLHPDESLESIEKTYEIIEEDPELVNSELFEIILNPIISWLSTLHDNELNDALTSLLLLNVNVSPKMSSNILQTAIFKLLDISSPSSASLSFIEKTVCVGWWESKLPELFDAICNSCSRFEITDKKEIRELIITILFLIPNIGSLSIYEHREFLFSIQLLDDRNYLFGIIHFICSDAFRNCFIVEIEPQKVNTKISQKIDNKQTSKDSTEFEISLENHEISSQEQIEDFETHSEFELPESFAEHTIVSDSTSEASIQFESESETHDLPNEENIHKSVRSKKLIGLLGNTINKKTKETKLDEKFSVIWETFLTNFSTIVQNSPGIIAHSFEGIFLSEAGQKFQDLAKKTNYFSSIDNLDEQGVILIKERAFSTITRFADDHSAKMTEINEEVKGIRIANSDPSLLKDLLIHEESEQLLTLRSQNYSLLRQYEMLSFSLRFNLISCRNEHYSFLLWTLFPSEISSQFQIAPSVHPISVPTLYVPFFSSFDVKDYVSYANYEKRKKTNIFGAKTSSTPPALPSFIPHFYFDIPSFNPYLFKIIYGEPITFSNVSLIYGGFKTKSVIISTQSNQVDDPQYYILLDSEINGNMFNNLTLIPPSNHLTNVIFLDSVVSGYYGQSQIFCGHPVILFKHSDILITVPRKFCEIPNSIEVWFVRGTSIFFQFNDDNLCKEYLQKFQSKAHLPHPHFTKEWNYRDSTVYSIGFSKALCKMISKKSDFSGFTKDWVQMRLSSFVYLLILNFFANRSFINMSQYPVMPWVTKRDFAMPMGQMNPIRAQYFESKLPMMGFLYGSLYSSPLLVYHWLMRVHPYSICHIDMQNGFDRPDRLFFSVENEWNAAKGANDQNVQELIPELFTLPELFFNENDLPIPPRSNGLDIRDVILPAGIKNGPEYCQKLRRDLEENENQSEEQHYGLEKWIDLIFGVNSRGEGAKQAKNVFHPAMYGNTNCVDIPNASIDTVYEIMMAYGQVPTQLFTEPHPPRDTINFTKPPLLIDPHLIPICQRVETFSPKDKETRNLAVFTKNGMHGIEDPTAFFSFINSKSPIKPKIINDGIFSWKDFNSSNFTVSSISNDLLLFCAEVGAGSLFVARAICQKGGKIVSYEFLSFCHLPPIFSNEFVQDPSLPVRVAVSSHLFLVCESCGKNLFEFHVSTGRFIRKLVFRGDLIKIVIDDASNYIYGFGVDFIQAFTINGTFVAETTLSNIPPPENQLSVSMTIVDNTSQISKQRSILNRLLNSPNQISKNEPLLTEPIDQLKITSGDVSVCDFEVFVATGLNDGNVILWDIDQSQQKIVPKKTIIAARSGIKAIKMLSHGSAMFIIDENDIAAVYAIRGIKTEAVGSGTALSCANCGKMSKRSLKRCSSCGLYYCEKCCSDQGSVLCHNCLEQIAAESEIDFS